MLKLLKLLKLNGPSLCTSCPRLHLHFFIWQNAVAENFSHSVKTCLPCWGAVVVPPPEKRRKNPQTSKPHAKRAGNVISSPVSPQANRPKEEIFTVHRDILNEPGELEVRKIVLFPETLLFQQRTPEQWPAVCLVGRTFFLFGTRLGRCIGTLRHCLPRWDLPLQPGFFVQWDQAR